MLVFRVWDWEVIAALGAAGHKEIRRETERERESIAWRKKERREASLAVPTESPAFETPAPVGELQHPK